MPLSVAAFSIASLGVLVASLTAGATSSAYPLWRQRELVGALAQPDPESRGSLDQPVAAAAFALAGTSNTVALVAPRCRIGRCNRSVFWTADSAGTNSHDCCSRHSPAGESTRRCREYADFKSADFRTALLRRLPVGKLDYRRNFIAVGRSDKFRPCCSRKDDSAAYRCLGEAVAGWLIRDSLLHRCPDLPADRLGLAFAYAVALADSEGYWSRLE